MNKKESSVKVTIIEPVGGHGGMHHYDFNLCRALAKAGADVALHTSDTASPKTLEPFSFRPTFGRIFDPGPTAIKAVRFIRAVVVTLITAVKEHRKICHFHFFNVGPTESCNVLLARILGRKIIITSHDIETFAATSAPSWVAKLTYRQADGIIVHNQFSSLELQRCTGVRSEKVRVIPPGHYLDQARTHADPLEARRNLGLSDTAPTLLFFGQIKDVKGLDILIRALALVKFDHPDVRLLIAGRPWKTDFSVYENLIDMYDLRDNCLLHPQFIPDEKICQYFYACDLVVLPYRRIYQSAVLFLAMSHEKPVLTSDIPGMVEVITDQETGFTFQSGDEKDLARVLSRLIDSPQALTRVAKNGMKLMIDNYNWDIVGQNTVEFYRSM